MKDNFRLDIIRRASPSGAPGESPIDGHRNASVRTTD